MEKKACWYSIVRYLPDSITGEVVNVGLLLHSVEDEINTRYLLIDENSLKIRALMNSIVEGNIYKTFKDSLEYYLQEASENLFGNVGEVEIGSPLKADFLERLYLYYKDKKLSITEPSFALTENTETLFNSLFETYIGSRYLSTTHKEVGVKQQLKDIFESRRLLNVKVKPDIEITPIEKVKSLKFKIDFGFKNGTWNYLQAVPNTTPNKNSEWFAKSKFMFENIDRSSKLYLMFRKSDQVENNSFYEVLDYLSKFDGDRIIKFDLDNQRRVNDLCRVIERDGHNIDDLQIS